jgi:hypothetical protein
MGGMGVVVLVVAVVCTLAIYVTWTAGRLDRLVARVESASSALDAQLVRRAGVAAELAAHARRHRLLPEAVAEAMEDTALAAQAAVPEDRERCENDLSRAIRESLELLTPGRRGKTERLLDDLSAAAVKVGLARQFFNDAVRDHRDQRGRWLPRILARGKPAPPPFFDIDDTALPDVTRVGRSAT